MFEIIITRDGSSRTVPLVGGGPWLIGRGAHCAIYVSDPFISAEHAELALDARGLRIRRTEGSNPITIGGKAVEESTLHAESVFDIGNTRFAVRSSAGAEDAATRLIDTCSVLQSSAGADETKKQPILLGQIAALLNDCADRQALGLRTLKFACERLNATRGLLASVEGNQKLSMLANSGFPAGAPVQDLISQSVLRQLLDQRQCILIGNASAASPAGIAESIARNGIRAIACAPILDGAGHACGVLYVDNLDRAREFDESDAEFLIWTAQLYRLLTDNLEMRARLEAEITALKRTAAGSQIVAESPAMLQLLERLQKAAASDANVLILGETGAGKECLARFIHERSARAKKSYVVRNCAAIPEEIFESEMFGHTKGAFTGAATARTGAFREADGGTLFLDEIGDLSYPLQSKLLRAIQEKKIRAVGADREVDVDIRVVSATNRDLRAAIKKHEFREDLFYRIATVSCTVPPLRERPEDIVPLARHFIQLFSGGARTLSNAAEESLSKCEWRGNVRELRACLEQAVIFSVGSTIQADELNISSPKVVIDLSRPDLVPLAQAERQHIVRVLAGVNGNKNEAARVLGIARSTLSLKLKEYRI